MVELPRHRLLLLLLVWASSLDSIPVVVADVACTQDSDCVTAFAVEGSECVGGICTNPFYNGGCLLRMLPGWTKVRTCNSDDPPSAVERGYCQSSAMDYREVRIASENWESAFFNTWILQILLSEVLDVPTTVESSSPSFNMNLYQVNSSFGYGATIDFAALELGYQIGDCREVKETGHNRYRPCSHVLPEYWDNGLPENSDHLTMNSLGCLAGESWYIPKFTARRDPTLVSYAGLEGEENREKLARLFRRPTTWKDYCELVSSDNCQTKDDVASRPPMDDGEATSFFVPNLYTGYFRATEKNDCEQNPTTCTGHIANWPCGWTSSVVQQAYHLNIALESDGEDPTGGGYSYEHLTQIWAAANATKSDVMMIWWKPEILYQTYIGTDSEFTPVILPPPTQTCYENRVFQTECGADLESLRGDPEGACDYGVKILNKVVSKALRDEDRDVPVELHSPAYDTLLNYVISDLDLGRISEFWLSYKTDPWNFDPRKAACQWVAANMDRIESFLPPTHPRTMEREQVKNDSLRLSGMVMSCLAIVILTIASLLTHLKRNSKAIFYTQEAFLLSILSGLIILSTGAMMLAFPPTDTSCIAAAWLMNLGSCVALVPLYARISAIHSFLQSGKKMQRVRLTRKKLVRFLTMAIAAVTGFLVVWTVLDSPEQRVYYELTSSVTSDGEFIVKAIDHCASENSFWMWLSFTWQGLVLAMASATAFMALSIREDINDTRLLAAVILSHLLFFVVKIILWLFQGKASPSALMLFLSLTCSVECLAALSIYIAPKLLDKNEEHDPSETAPDLFIETTILVADISGFSAWSSVREPGQVFKFLEIVYGALDEIADKRKVFKVETTGDSYVAATGIPRYQADHAVVMARFAFDCLAKMYALSHEMDVMFGPDTSRLSLRIGIHSGPVTGGFLKGKGARFQLFGETMITSTQMARTGDSIHISNDTANHLIKAGKQRWLVQREEKTPTSSKGLLQTYWLKRSKISDSGNTGVNPGDNGSEMSSEFGSDLNYDGAEKAGIDEVQTRNERLIDWNVEVLHQLLRQIVARRQSSHSYDDDCGFPTERETSGGGSGASIRQGSSVESTSHPSIRPGSSVEFSTSTESDTQMPLDEVKEVIALPRFNRKAAMQQKDADSIRIPTEVLDQLKFLVTTISRMYKENPFHNFAHASHVVMAVTKYMNRINEGREMEVGDEKERKFNEKKFASALHDHTYGITSDPLTQFACVFSALIHDVDHPGVPNPQLIKENEHLASLYHNRSVAEQNSFDLSWELLMDEQFKDLRSVICGTKGELMRFRQLVINSVMATDLGDQELKKLRNARWEKAFSQSGSNSGESSGNSAEGSGGVSNSIRASTRSKNGSYKGDSSGNAGDGAGGGSNSIRASTRLKTNFAIDEDMNRKATIVVEHLIQAADVSHTTQHWEVYRMWNENLFRELYKAYREGRAVKNPSEFWYEGEIGFFDFYIIPLAKKLRDCGVFGVTSDENLNYAMQNRALWVENGPSIVADMLKRAEAEFGS